MLGKAREACAGAEKFHVVAFFREQGAQDHEAPFLIEQFGRGIVEFVENKTREALKRENAQARVAAEGIVGEQLAFELEGGLLGREQNQRRAVRRRSEGGADFRQAAEGLAAAGGAEEEPDLHGPIFSRMGFSGKKLIWVYRGKAPSASGVPRSR